MSDEQKHAADSLSHETISESESARLKDELLEMRRTTIVNNASRTALIAGVLTFLLLGGLGLTLGMILGLVVGAVLYLAKKASLERKALPPVADYDDQRLQRFHRQAILEQVAAQKRSNIARGFVLVVAIVLVIVWVVARVQR
jgi:MFS superfamily sulfate permease-like transporter